MHWLSKKHTTTTAVWTQLKLAKLQLYSPPAMAEEVQERYMKLLFIKAN
jgi:hypothetical protein